MWLAHHVVETRARALPLRADRGRKEQPRPCRVPLEDRSASGLEGPAATTTSSRCPASAASPWASSASAPATRASAATASTSTSTN